MPFLDKSKLIFHCISLRSDTKRRKKLNQHAKEYKFNIQYHLFDRHPTSGQKGCMNSHIELYRYCIEKGLPFIAILEDDPLPSPNFDAFWTSPVSESIHKLLYDTEPGDWPCDSIVLGSPLWFWNHCEPTYKQGLYYTFSGCHSGMCYIINRKSCQEMVRQYEHGNLSGHIDMQLSQRTRQWLARPLLFHCQDNVSNNNLTRFEKFMRIMYFGQKGNAVLENHFFEGRLFRTLWHLIYFVCFAAAFYIVLATFLIIWNAFH